MHRLAIICSWKSLLASLTGFLCVACASAQIIRVPRDVATIQQALDRAAAGVTVLVDPGVYRERLVWPDRAGIRLVSAGDSSDTWIIGDGTGPVIKMKPQVSEIDTSTTIQGFQITGGLAENGGGVALHDASPLLARLWIRRNRAADSGGGVYVQGSPVLRHVRIEANSASEDLSYLLSGGGGIFVAGGSPRLLHVTIIGNSVAAGGLVDAGGGVFTNVDSRLLFEDGVVEGNVAHEGGGLFLRGSSRLRRVRIVRNQASRAGGGISSGDHTHLEDVFISENRSRELGGGAYFFGRTTVDHATISHNHAGKDGGGAYLSNGTTLRGVTVASNGSDGCGGLSVHGGFARRKPELSHLNVAYNGRGVCNRTEGMVTVHHSWFGHPLGPEQASGLAAGRGDAVIGFVDTPFWHSLPDSIAPPPPVRDVRARTAEKNAMEIEWEPSSITDIRAYQICAFALSDRNSCDQLRTVNSPDHKVTIFVPDGERRRIGVRVIDDRGRRSWWSLVADG